MMRGVGTRVGDFVMIIVGVADGVAVSVGAIVRVGAG
jgi:hypothetical protein